jgi:hypothetical protein
MRKITLSIVILMILPLMALPAQAGGRGYVEDVLDKWVDFAERDGYEVIRTEIGQIEESVSYTLDLDSGAYHFYAEGGEDIEDLDMFVYDENGDLLDSDELNDNYPICDTVLDEPQRVEVKLTVYSFLESNYRDYFCFVAARETSGGELGPDGGRGETLKVEDVLAHWVEYATNEGYGIVLSETGELSGSRNAYHNLSLEAGQYHLYTQTRSESDDIDLNVYDANGSLLGSDTLADNYPVVDFRMRQPGDIQIEILPYEYQSGDSTEYAIVLASEGQGGVVENNLGPEDVTGPVTPQSDLDYVTGIKNEQMETIAHEGYTMIFDNIDTVSEGSTYSFPLTVGEGDYVVYAFGGPRIADLDLAVYSGGELVDEDSGNENIAQVGFSANRSTSFEIEVSPYEMESRFHEGCFLVIVVRE